MPQFYTVARYDISSYSSLELYNIDELPQNNQIKGYLSDIELNQYLQYHFPKGISQHGKNYLFTKYLFAKDQAGKDFVAYTHLIECTFELVRQLHFNQLPSRFSCSFGCLTFEDACKFKNEYCAGQGTIYLVSCSDFFVRDMKMLVTGGSICGNILVAQKYWKGETSLEPFGEVLMYSPPKILCSVNGRLK